MCNTATITRTSRACLAASALVILSVSLAEAAYGPRTKIGNNYQQTSTTKSSDGSTEGSCNGGNTCYVLFQLPPAQKPLIVQTVSCRVLVNAGGLDYAWLRSRKASVIPLRRTYLAPVKTTNGNHWIVSSPVMHLIESGERPVVFIANSAGATWSIVECTISGQLQ
jgi:hypothetical protein